MTKKKTRQGRGETGEIIIHPLAKAPEPFLEEINTVRLEGRYFAFDPKRANARPARQEFKDGEQKLEIVVHPEYEQPSILAYRILQHVFLKITKEGKPFPDVVSFSYREIGRLIGRDVFGGKDVREIERAIQQLSSTHVVETTTSEKNNKTRKINYSLIITSGIITEGTSGNGRLQTIALQIHPLIMESMRRDHFIILNWPVIADLPPLSATLYKRLYLYFSNLYQNKHSATSLSFESRRILQFERAADEAKVQKPLAITRYFFEQRLGSTSPKGTYSSAAWCCWTRATVATQICVLASALTHVAGVLLNTREATAIGSGDLLARNGWKRRLSLVMASVVRAMARRMGLRNRNLRSVSALRHGRSSASNCAGHEIKRLT